MTIGRIPPGNVCDDTGCTQYSISVRPGSISLGTLAAGTSRSIDLAVREPLATAVLGSHLPHSGLAIGWNGLPNWN